MPFSPKSLDEKPYNACLNCAHIGKKCDGPNFLAMSVDRWCEWCRIRKEYLGWTNSHVADLSGISKVSVDRALSGSIKDIRISTMQAITKALVNGSWGQYPCAMSDIMESQPVYVDNPTLVERVNHLETTHADDQKKISFLKEQIHFKEEQLIAKDKLLEERAAFMKRKDTIITILSVILALCLLLIISALVIDRIDSSIGFFWLEGFFKPHSITDIVHNITT